MIVILLLAIFPSGSFSVDAENNTVSSEKALNNCKKLAEPLSNKHVKLFLKYYSTIGKKYLSESFSRMCKYYPVISEIFKKYNVPECFILLPVLTSFYKRQSSFASGEAGLWKFNPQNAKKYGLEINHTVDERFDIVKSTIAAAKHINRLKRVFNNYDMVIAAYGTNLNYMMQKVKQYKTKNFWKIVEKKGFEKDLEYVPKFHAVLNIALNPQQYGFKNIYLNRDKYFEVIAVRQKLNLSVIAKILNLRIFEIKSINYQLKGNIVPDVKGSKKYHIRIPVNFKKIFIRKKYLLKPYLIKTRVYYVRNKVRVKRGDNLSKIARRYRVSLRKLIRINRIRNPRALRPGRILRLPRKSKVVKKYKVPNPLFKNTKIYRRLLAKQKRRQRIRRIRKRRRRIRARRRRRRRIARLRRIRRKRRARRRKRRRKKRVIVYKIKRGDTVSELALKFKVSSKKIIRANRGKIKLIIGKVLKIRRY